MGPAHVPRRGSGRPGRGPRRMLACECEEKQGVGPGFMDHGAERQRDVSSEHALVHAELVRKSSHFL